jgi:ubiquinone/menaquinone biosynthesis C-methylase UbiE
VNRLLHRFFHQFHEPTGAFGAVAGWMLAAKGERAIPLVEAAGLQPDERALDIGCGPGVAVDRASHDVPRGQVTGIDPSAVMVRQARRRTRAARNVTIEPGTAEAIPLGDATVDVAWAINTMHHWSDRSVGLAEVRRVLRPGGRFLVVEQRRHGRTGSALDSDAAAALIADLEQAGFGETTVERFTAGGETHTLARVVSVARATCP